MLKRLSFKWLRKWLKQLINEKSLGISDTEACGISSQSLLNKRNKLIHEADIERYQFTSDSVTTSPFHKCSEVLEIKILKFSNRNNYSEVL